MLDKASNGEEIRRLQPNDPSQGYTFKKLVQEWKDLHYLEIEFTSEQYYETRLPHLSFLDNFFVTDINESVVTKLVKHWLSDEYPKPKDRQTFSRELDALKIVLNFYRRHKNRQYFMPILPEHYRAADIAKKEEKPVRSLREDDLGKFLVVLKDRYPNFYPVALVQLGFGLRISEALALCWDDIDLENRDASIGNNLAWNKKTRLLVPKKRKNKKRLQLVIPEFLVEAFEKLQAERRKDIPHIFHRNGEYIRRQQVTKAYHRVLESLGIKYVSGTHMLRKTSGTLARKITRDVYAASKLLDHSSVTITEKYYQEHVDEDKQKVADALNGVFVSVTKQNDPPPSNQVQKARGNSRPLATPASDQQGEDQNAQEVSRPLVTPQTGRPNLKLVNSIS